MPRIRIPQPAQLRSIQSRKPKDFTQEILAVEGQSPLAEAVTTFGKVAGEGIGEAMKNRRELAQLIDMGKKAGLEESTLRDLGKRPETRRAAIQALTQKGLQQQLMTPEERETEGLQREKLKADIEAKRREPNYLGIGPNGQLIQLPTGAKPFSLPAGPQPSLPQGFRMAEGGKAAEPIPGTPAAEKVEKTRISEGKRKRAFQTVVEDVGRAIDVLGKNRKKLITTGAGPLAVISKHIPGSDADTINRMMESVKSNISIDQLQSMREASPTGGALGQVPVQQQVFLMQVLGSLDVAQRPQVTEDNLRRVWNIYNDIIHGEGNGPRRYQLSFDESGRPREKKEWGGIGKEMGKSPQGNRLQPLPMPTAGVGGRVGRFKVEVEP